MNMSKKIVNLIGVLAIIVLVSLTLTDKRERPIYQVVIFILGMVLTVVLYITVKRRSSR